MLCFCFNATAPPTSQPSVHPLSLHDALPICDPYVADPGVELDVEEMGTSLTVALLRHGQPLFGPSEEILRKLDVPRDPTHGPDSADWLGMPMQIGRANV